MARASGSTLLLLLIGAVCFAGSGDLDAVVARAIRGSYEALHGCYRKVLAVDRSRGGTLFVRLTLGQKDAVRDAQAARDEVGDQEAASCVLAQVRGWTLEGAAAAGAGPGSELTVPLTFQPMLTQCAVHAEDIPRQPLSSGASVQLLLHQRNVGATRGALVLIASQGTARPASGAAQVLVVLKGQGWLKVQGARRRTRLSPGGVVWVGSPRPSEIEAGGELELLQILMPGGSEQAYASGSATPHPRWRGVVELHAAPARPPLLGVVSSGRVVPRLEGRRVGCPGFALTERRFFSVDRAAGHAHEAAEMIYVLSGQGQLTLGEQTIPLTAGVAAYVAEGREHVLKGAAGPVLHLLEVHVPASCARQAQPRAKEGER